MQLISYSKMRDGTTSTLLIRGNRINYMLVACADLDYFKGGSSKVETKLTIFQKTKEWLVIENTTSNIGLDQEGMEHYLDELLEDIMVEGIRVF